MQRSRKSTLMRRGLLAFVALAVLTAVEYAAAGLEYALPVLAVIALAKAAAILQYFMHVSQLWLPHEHEEE